MTVQDVDLKEPLVFKGLRAHAQRLWVYRDMVYNLIRKDFRVRYQGAALGFAWSLGNPLALIILYDVIFTHVFRANIKDYVLYIFIGVVSYNLFSQAVLQGCESLTGAASFLQKIYFPRILVPTANVLFRPLLNSEWVPIMDRIPPEDLMGSGGYGGSEAVRGGLGD